MALTPPAGRAPDIRAMAEFAVPFAKLMVKLRDASHAGRPAHLSHGEVVNLLETLRLLAGGVKTDRRWPLESARAVVEAQALDEGLWFEAVTAPEAYLQEELRRLHTAVEGEFT